MRLLGNLRLWEEGNVPNVCFGGALVRLAPGHTARQGLPSLDAGDNVLVTRSYGAIVCGQDPAHTAPWNRKCTRGRARTDCLSYP